MLTPGANNSTPMPDVPFCVPWSGCTGVIICWRYVLTIMERDFLSKWNGVCRDNRLDTGGLEPVGGDIRRARSACLLSALP